VVAWSRRHTQVFIATVAVLAALPWSVRHWPSQDGQNHLAVAHILMHYGDPGSPFPQYLDIETGFRPSAATYEILCFLGRFMALQTAEKVMVSLAIALLPVSLLLLVRRALPNRTVNVMLALPFAVGWAFAMGFVSFLLCMGFSIVTLALGWEPPVEGQAAPRVGGRHLLAAVTYFIAVWFHPVGAMIAGLAMLLLEWRSLRRPTEWLRILVVTGPAALFLVGSYLAAHPAPQSSAVPTETYFADPMSLLGGLFEYHLAYTPLELVPRLVALVLMVRFAYAGMRKSSPMGATAEGAIGRVIIAFMVLYCVTPSALRGWFYSSTRFLLYASLLLPALADIPARIQRRLILVGPVLAAAVLVAQWPNIWATSRQMQDILDVGATLPRGAKLVPMDFSVRLLGPQPLDHAWAELLVDREVVASQMFAAGKPRMGGERFRTLTFHPGTLDIETGKLPWSTFETWYDDVRKCSYAGTLRSWLVHVNGTCEGMLAERKAGLEAVIDRYDYVLMIDPPQYGRDLIAPHLKLLSHVGSAWMYAVVR